MYNSGIHHHRFNYSIEALVFQNIKKHLIILVTALIKLHMHRCDHFM